ncbi:hypothetical protein VKT23_018377 [Stygiomarasmius scandens]|uniref:Protein-S-isoprenylcysteine O-methyltransferase n=1 Tax=Marasmiellus scandens TaxID=2682957 RepID=A0ABR1ITN1_9AGAR
MSFYKLACCLVPVASVWIGMTPPSPPAQTKDRVTERYNFVTRITGPAANLPMVKLFLISVPTIEIFALLTHLLGSSNLNDGRNMILRDVSSTLMWTGKADALRMNVISHLGVFLLASGAFLRMQCYGALGKFFTFDIASFPDHKLVTSGPYSLVRHPAYTGTYCVGLGCYLFVFSKGSWVRESGVLDTVVGKIVLGGYAFAIFSGLVAMLRRTKIEDQLLKDKFGKEWEEWAKKVPYKLLPGIY